MAPTDPTDPMRMNRREALKLLGAAPALAAPALATMAAPPAPAPAPAAAAYQPRALDAHEYRLLGVLADLIIPADDRTGSATAAGVPACVDDWLTIRGELLRDQIRGGFLWLDLESRSHHGRDFADAAPAQQRRLLDRIAWPARAAAADSNAAAFFSRLRDLVVSAFYSSPMGVDDLRYLGNRVVADWQGCPDGALRQIGLGSYAASRWRTPFPAPPA